jgi:hypothetical protein
MTSARLFALAGAVALAGGVAMLATSAVRGASPPWVEYTCRAGFGACIDATRRHLGDCTPIPPATTLAIARDFSKSSNRRRQEIGSWVLRYEVSRSSVGCMVMELRP